MKRQARARGASMIEMMIAGAVLLTGLVGILQLVILGMGHLRNADVQRSAQEVVQSTLSDYRGQPYAQLVAGTYTLPDYTDDVGRVFSRSAVVASISDGGTYGAMQVSVTVNWSERMVGIVNARQSTGTALISEIPPVTP